MNGGGVSTLPRRVAQVAVTWFGGVTVLPAIETRDERERQAAVRGVPLSLRANARKWLGLAWLGEVSLLSVPLKDVSAEQPKP